MSVTKFYKIIKPTPDEVSLPSNQDLGVGGGVYGNYSWYNRTVHGSANRLVKYREYDIMDNDIDISRSLDIIAEEMTGNNPKNKEPLQIQIIDAPEQQISSNTILTLKAGLRTWTKIQEWDKRIYDICRSLIKYGDCFFIKPKKKKCGKLKYIHPKNVIHAIVAEDDITEIRGWHIKPNHLEVNSSWDASANAGAGDISDQTAKVYKASEVMRFTLSDEMSDEAPFGNSLLRPVYTTFKQKELLEDAILIYRIQRAPERRVFYIDVGKMPPAKIKQHLTQVKNEIKQKKIPSQYGGKNQVDSVYNPQSQSEDIFLPQRADGSGTKVETLPGGQGLGELSDLEYFYKKMWRAMRIPNSYMSNMPEDGGTDNNGRVGIAYMQETKFTLFIQRLQTYVERELDKEFKSFLYHMDVKVDPTIYNVRLPEPSDYSKSREQAMFGEELGNYTNAQNITGASERFIIKKYLNWTDEEIKINERMKAEELGLDVNRDRQNLPQIYSPETAEQGGFEGGLGSFSDTDGGAGLPDEGGELGDDVDTDNPEGAPEGDDAGPETPDTETNN